MEIAGGYSNDEAEADGARAYDADAAAQNLRYPRNFPGNMGAEQAVKRRDNRSAIPDKGKSRFVGVCWSKQGKKWQVQVTDMGKKKFLGVFDDETAAARAFDAYVIANKINRDLNFPSAPGAAGHRTTKKGGTSRYRGVCWYKSTKKWRARIGVDGKTKHLGSFVDEDDAGRAYDAAVRKHYPDARPKGWRRFNFPSADGEEGSADGGDDAGSARGGASSSAAVEASDEENKDDVRFSSDEEEEERRRRRKIRTHAEVLVGIEWLNAILRTDFALDSTSSSADVDCAAHADFDLNAMACIVEAGEEPRPKRRRVAFSVMTAYEVGCAANAEVDFKAKTRVVEAGEETCPKRRRVAFPVMTAYL
jgi:hypothetical protein